MTKSGIMMIDFDLDLGYQICHVVVHRNDFF